MSMRRQFNTDCEGPISKNDNAFELAEEFIPRGGEFFAKLSKYDDFLADIEEKPGYKAGDTLRLILPFFKAYGVTDVGIREFSSKNVLLVPGADTALLHIHAVMPAFIISTSYRPYIDALCELIGFPTENTYCTELNLDKYRMSEAEIKYLKKTHDEILELPAIELPASATSKEDLDDGSITCIDTLDQIFWKDFPDMASGKILRSVNPMGGFVKADAREQSCEETGFDLDDVMYVGDSITDVEAMKLVRSAGGLAVAFNANRYAIEAADIAVISPNALIFPMLALIFTGGAESVCTLAAEWESESGKINLAMIMGPSIPGFSVEGTSLYLIEDSDLEELVSQSESFRKTVRGERIGQLG